LAEDWSGGVGPSWVPFGDPLPRIDSTSDGARAFLNAGDGSFVSGAYSTSKFPTSHGLALDGWISAQITKIQWQFVSVGFDGGLDDAGLRRWGHRFGNYPRRDNDWPFCDAHYPSGSEGTAYGDSAGGTAGRPSKHVVVPAPPNFRTGARISVRIQVFPDGRCGVALNGVPVVVTPNRVMPDSVVRVMIFGNSSETKVLVGPVSVRTGVPGDIDWARVGAAVPNVPSDAARP
jgi:hypothetical protein